MMNLMRGGGLVWMGVHGGGGVLSMELSAPVVCGRDGGTGDSAVFRMVDEPGEEAYEETRLYRYDGASRCFRVLDGVFGLGVGEVTVEGLGAGRQVWLPVAFDVEGNYAPGAVVGVLVTDGSAGLVERVMAELVAALRSDAGLRALHAEWGETEEGRCHVFSGSRDARMQGRLPCVAVEVEGAERRSVSVVRARFVLRLATAGGMEGFAEGVSAAVMAPENGWVRSGDVLDVRLRWGEAERAGVLRRLSMVVEADLAARR